MQLPSKHDLVGLARRAGRPIKNHFRKEVDVRTKKDGTPVTNVDMMVHETVRQWVQQYPGVGFISEEVSEEGAEFSLGDMYAIYVDPLDGTDAYRRGIPTATCVLSLMEQRENGIWYPTIGVIHDPFNDWTWSAEENGPTEVLEPNPRKTPGIKGWQPFDHEPELSQVVDEGAPYQVTVVAWPDVGYHLDRVFNYLRHSDKYPDQQFGSIALGGGLIASGRMQAIMHGSKSAVETAAMTLIVRGAGGKATDLVGRDLTGFFLSERDGKLDFLLENGALFTASQAITDQLVYIITNAQTPLPA